MSEEQKKSIFQFVKKAHEELKETTQQEDFADLIFEIYKSVDPKQNFKEKVKFIKNEMQDEDIAASDFIETNVDTYIERLVGFVEKQTRRSNRSRSRSNSRKSRRSDKEDPLERNNLKAGDSSVSSDNDDKRDRKQHRLQLKQKQNKGDSRDYRHNNDDHKRDQGRDSRRQGNRNNNNNRKQNTPYNLPNLLMMSMQGLNKFNPQLSLNEVMNSIRPNYNDNRNRKDTVFLLNLPRELRSLVEIDEIFRNKGAINNVNLAGRVPSVQFKKAQDAQNLINNDKYIVHKGIKVELSSSPNYFKQRGDRQQTRLPEDGERKQRRNDVEVQDKQVEPEEAQLNNLDTQKPQDDQIKKKAEQAKQERDLQKQMDSMKSGINTLLAEKLRTLLYLTKREYSSDIKEEIEEKKRQLKTMREGVKAIENINNLKEDQALLQETFNHTLLVKNIPEELFENRTIMKTLTDYFQQYGKIDNLQIKPKEHGASIKYQNFESAEKTYLAPQQYQLEFVHSNILRYLKSSNE